VRHECLDTGIDAEQHGHQHREQRAADADPGHGGIADMADQGDADQAHQRLRQQDQDHRQRQVDDDPCARLRDDHANGLAGGRFSG
jgi:hypothetical protein